MISEDLFCVAEEIFLNGGVKMSETKTRYDITSADSKIIGFDYQFFYFVKAVLLLKRGQDVGYEVKDDVHITFPDGRLVLIQLKHTTQQTAANKPINLTELDDDLTKSLYNWALVICDASDGRSKLAEQIDFVKNTRFILATNKCIDHNVFIDNIINTQKEKMTVSNLIKYIENLASKTTSEEAKRHLNALLLLENSIFSDFIKNIKFENQASDIAIEIKELIGDNYIGENRINDVFNAVFSELKLAHMEAARHNSKLVVTYSDWYNKITKIFENNRTTTLPIRKLERLLPDNLQSQQFVKELIAIGDIDILEVGQIEDFTSFMLEIEMNLKMWLDDGDITKEELDNYKADAILFWTNTHKASHRATKDDNSNITSAIACLDNIRKQELKVQETSLSLKLSNGSFYKLANEYEIGWLKKWEGKYKR